MNAREKTAQEKLQKMAQRLKGVGEVQSGPTPKRDREEHLYNEGTMKDGLLRRVFKVPPSRKVR